jgi:hypothetical protein
MAPNAPTGRHLTVKGFRGETSNETHRDGDGSHLFNSSAAGHGTNDFDDHIHVEARINFQTHVHVEAGGNVNGEFDRNFHVEAHS